MKFADFFSPNHRLLVAVAAYPEVIAVLDGLGVQEDVRRNRWQAYRYNTLTVLQTGVGKANAAGALSAELLQAKFDEKPYAAVLSLGISGSYDTLAIGATILADAAILADEGLENADGFESIEDRGWALTRFQLPHLDFQTVLKPDHIGTVATISAIAGTRALAAEYRRRTEAIAEDMETAALALVCQHYEVPLAALRIVSNQCGEPSSWNAKAGFDRITEIVQGWNFTPGAPDRP